ncbi:MAG: hypothetical protein ACKOYC_01750 [Bacteroidota bacterium]
MQRKTPMAIFISLLVAMSVFVAMGAWSPSPPKDVSRAFIDSTFSPLSPSFFGFNAQQIRGPSLSDKRFVRAAMELHPKILRFPGGTVASYWDWKAGWFKDEIPLKKDWREIRKNPIVLDDLKYACDSTGATPLFVLNMCTSDLEYQLEMLRTARKKGMPIKYVELDNEVYLSEGIYTDRFSSGEEYARICNEWIKSIRKEFTGVRISVVGYSAKESDIRKEKQGLSRALNWNHEVLSKIEGADAMTFHVYGGNGLGFLKNPGDLSGDEDKEPEEFQRIFDRAGSASVITGMPFTRWSNSIAYDLRMLPKGMKAWITEYNLFEREGVVAGTWVHGLYALTQAMLMVTNPNVEVSCFHNLCSSAQFGAIFNSNQGFLKSVKQKPTTEFGKSASGYCLSLLGKALHGAESVASIRFDKTNPLVGARGKEHASLFGITTKSKSNVHVLLINYSNNPRRVDISAVSKTGDTWIQYSSESTTQIGTEKDLRRKNLKNGTVADLPPYSVTLVTSGIGP